MSEKKTEWIRNDTKSDNNADFTLLSLAELLAHEFISAIGNSLGVN